MKLQAKTYILEREYDLDRETAWRLLADNNRMNLYIGLFPVNFSNAKKDSTEVFYREAHAKLAGVVPISWQEFPFQWEEHKSYTVERRYLSGPLQRYRLQVELFESGSSGKGTKVRLTAEFLPRNVLGYGAIWATGLPAIKNIMGYLDAFLQTGVLETLDAPQKSGSEKINRTELNRLCEKLATYPVDARWIELLNRYLLEKNDHDVALIEPYRLAEVWKAELDDVVRVLLYATKAGLLNLSWNLICPNCRVSKVEHSSLSQLEQEFHCDLCGVNYDANFDQYVELTFSVNRAIRVAYAEVYCIGGPMITPHVKVQKIVERHATIRFPVPAAHGDMRLRVLQANHRVNLKKDNSCSELIYSDLGWSAETIGSSSEVVISNSSSTDIVVALEEIGWNKEAVTAAQVTTMQEFRDLFSSEVLSPGQKIEINHVTILFTDLKESTALYETIGDASAYGQVRDHFDFITQIVASHQGSVVKTIGDAVMAVFHLPENGLKAALAIQHKLADFNLGRKDDLVLKAGLFSGPAIVVNSNDRLDYFGRTVNIAARIQGQSKGNDVVISQEVLDQKASAILLEAEGIRLHSHSVMLKGIEGRKNLVRVRVQPQDTLQIKVVN